MDGVPPKWQRMRQDWAREGFEFDQTLIVVFRVCSRAEGGKFGRYMHVDAIRADTD